MYYVGNKSKYKNKKIFYKNELFDSIKEKNCWIALLRMQQRGEIYDLKRQVKFILIPSQYEEYKKKLKNGDFKTEQKLVERECSYIADFTFKDTNGNLIVADCKSDYTNKNSQFIIKRKLMYFVHKIKIKILK